MSTSELKNFILASIISAENDKYTEEEKQEVMRRYELEKEVEDKDWEFILAPVDKEGKLIKLFI